MGRWQRTEECANLLREDFGLLEGCEVAAFVQATLCARALLEEAIFIGLELLGGHGISTLLFVFLLLEHGKALPALDGIFTTPLRDA
jgi:hypothetical protein